MPQAQSTAVLTVRLSPEEAIKNHLEVQAWQVESIHNAVKKADSKNAKFVEHKHVTDWLSTWGKEKVAQFPLGIVI